MLHVLDGVDQSPIQARPYIWVGGRCQGHTSAVVPATGIRGWCVKGMSASLPVRFIFNRGSFLIALFTQNSPQIVSSHLA